jgi:hypothetical protein
MKSRNYVFTVNNYTQKMLKQFEKVAKSCEKHNYICYGLEVGDKKKTKHIQAYIQLADSQRFTFLHKYFNLQKKGKLDKFHIEPAKGSLDDNKKYTSKSGDWYEFGEPKKQGARNDLSRLKKAVAESPRSIVKIIKEDVENNQQLRFIQNLQPFYLEHRTPDLPPKVYWIYGKSGIGKTKLVFDSFDEVCSVSNYDWIGTGYLQQQCLLFDDFRKGDIPFHILLKITDRYPFTLFYKGGSIPLNSEYIIFTSPRSITDTFGHTYGFEDDEELVQLLRRVKEINLDSFHVKDLKKL